MILFLFVVLFTFSALSSKSGTIETDYSQVSYEYDAFEDVVTLSSKNTLSIELINIISVSNQDHSVQEEKDVEEDMYLEILVNHKKDIIAYDIKEGTRLAVEEGLISCDEERFGLGSGDLAENLGIYFTVERVKELTETEFVYLVKRIGLGDMFKNLEMEIKINKVDGNRRISGSTKKQFYNFEFNYDNDTNKVLEESITLYEDDQRNKIDCKNCYVFFEAGIILKIKIGTLSLDYFKAGVYGDFDSEINILYDFQTDFHKFWEFLVFEKTYPTITFTLGEIPIVVKPKIELFTEIQVNFTSRLRFKTGVSFTEYAEFSLIIDDGDVDVESIIDDPTYSYYIPEVSRDSRGGANTSFALIPKLTLFFYESTPFFIKPRSTFYFDGLITYYKLQYETFYDVSIEYGLKKMELPDSIPIIGGTKCSIGGALPVVREDEIVQTQSLECEYCNGDYLLSEVYEDRDVQAYHYVILISCIIIVIFILVASIATVILFAFWKQIKKPKKTNVSKVEKEIPKVGI